MSARAVFLTVIVILGLAIAGGIVYSMSAAVPVETAVAAVGPIREFVDERGMTRLPKTYLITMPAAGRIEAITLSEGAAVRKPENPGERETGWVARIVPRDLELAEEQATAAVERLEASIKENDDASVEETTFQQMVQFVKSMTETVKAAAARVKAGAARFEYATNDLQRVEKLAQTGTRTRDELEQTIVRKVEADVDYQQDQLVHAAMVAMQAATDLAPTMVRQYINRKKTLGRDVLAKQKLEAEANLKKVLQDKDRGTMYSPVDGVVLKRFVSDERYLAAGEPLLEIGRLEDLEVEADILSLDVVDAKAGDRVEIYGPAVGKEPARGAVARIYPAGFTKVSSLGVEQQRVKVIVDFDPDDLRRLRETRNLGVGYRVRVRIITAEEPKALVIPRSALFRSTDGDWQVYVVRGGRAVLQKITLGLLNDEHAQVTAGIEAGEPVVLAPESNLTDGTRVTAAR